MCPAGWEGATCNIGTFVCDPLPILPPPFKEMLVMQLGSKHFVPDGLFLLLQQETAAACQTPVTAVGRVLSVGIPLRASAKRAGKVPLALRVSPSSLSVSS